MADNVNIVKIEKLDGSNFLYWKKRVTLLLKTKKLWTIVSGELKKPSRPEETIKWEESDVEAMSIIVNSMDDSIFKQVMTAETSNNLWSELLNIFERRSDARITELQTKLLECKLQDEQPVVDYVSEMKNLKYSLETMGEGISEGMLIAKILNGLPTHKYGKFLTAWRSKSKNDKTLINLTSELSAEEALINKTESNIVAMAAAEKQNSKKKNSYHKNTRYVAEKKEETGNVCFYCKKPGHKRINCYKWKNNSHNYNTKKNPKGQASGRRRKDEEKSSDEAFMVNITGSKLDELKNDSVFEMKEVTQFIMKSSNTEWIGDSGASCHMTNDRDNFTTFEEIHNHPGVTTANKNASMQVKGKGTVRIQRLMNGQWSQGRLEDVLYVPELKRNLFSFRKCSDNGFRWIGNSKGVKIVNCDNEVRMIGVRDNNHYRMIFETVRQSQALLTEVKTMQEWHEKLGHASPDILRKMAKENAAIGLDIEEDVEFDCEACNYGKQHRASYKKEGRHIYEIGEKIHSDVCGPMEVDGLYGERWFVIFKDDATGYRTVYCLRQKSDVLSKFIEFANQLRNKFGRDMRIFRSDNGTEYTNKEFQLFLKKHGIVHETSAPYTPEQNGMAERDIRTIVETGRSMMYGKHVKRFLWTEAVRTAVLLLNQTCTKKTGDKTAFELWNNKRPNFNNLHVFGTTVYAHIPSVHRKKWDAKARKTLFVGYQGQSDNFKLYDEQTKKFFYSKNVKFSSEIEKHEDQFAIIHMNTKKKENQQQIEDTLEENDERAAEEEHYEEPLEENESYRNKLRKPEERKITNRYEAYLVDECDCITYEEAMKSDAKHKWEAAIKEEVEAHERNGTWIEAKVSEDQRIIDCRWLLKIKIVPKGRPRYKARLVARGFRQKEGVDYQEIYAPVVRHETVRIMLAKAASERMHIKQFDVKTAFLYGTLEEDIWLQLPQGPWGQNKIVKCIKSLYGLKQSPNCWNKRFVSFLKKFYMKQSLADDCLFIGEEGGCKFYGLVLILYLILYVDDGLLLCEKQDLLNKIINNMKTEFEIKVSQSNYFVGYEIEQHKDGSITIHQETYINRMLEKFGMQDAKEMSTPLDTNVNFNMEINSSNDNAIVNVPYRELIGSLQFAVNLTRPDIAYAVNLLSRFMEKPKEAHWKALKRVLRYLKGTKKHGISYRNGSRLQLMGYCDSDYAGDEHSSRSTSGYIFILSGGPISWASRRQSVVALSTVEAEYISACTASQEASWLECIFTDLQGKKNNAITLYCDNQGTISLCKNPVFHRKTKHIRVRYHYIREKVKAKELEIKYISTEDNIADALTKGLPRARFKKLIHDMGLIDLNCYTSGSVEDLTWRAQIWGS